MVRKSNNIILRGGQLLAIFSVVFLLTTLVASSIIIPATIPNASAYSSTKISGGTNDSSSTTADGYTLSISVPNSVYIDLFPSPSSDINADNGRVEAYTNSPGGYTLTMHAIGKDAAGNTTNKLINTNNNITTHNEIPTLDDDVTINIPTDPGAILEEILANFPVNRWGYYNLFNNSTSTPPTSLTISPMPTTPTIIRATNTATDDSLPFAVTVKADNDLAAGTYTNTVQFSITANAIPFTFSGIKTMQEMTPAICAAETTPVSTATQTTTIHSDDTNFVPEAILKDTRDNNTYVVRKLADGKCWMTQNLRLGTQALPSAATISSNITLTSANSNVTSNFTIPTSTIQTSGSIGWKYDEVRVYNNGNSWVAPTSEGNNSTVNTTGTPPNQSQYIGNYYNWYTATAGTGTTSISSGNVSSSICPKGWKLPTGGANSDITSLTGSLVNITSNAGYVPTQSFTMQSAPNYFILSGIYNNSGVSYQGSSGHWWSSTVDISALAYLLLLDTSNVYPWESNSGYYGFSIRCVAQ